MSGVSCFSTSVAGASFAFASSATLLFASCKNPAISSLLYTSQNSSCAVLCNSLETRSLSLAPGNSTNIRAEFPKRCMFGCVTPNLSIRLRSTSKADVIDSSIFLLITFFTSSLDMVALISSSNPLLKKISGDASTLSPSRASKAV